MDKNRNSNDQDIQKSNDQKKMNDQKPVDRNRDQQSPNQTQPKTPSTGSGYQGAPGDVSGGYKDSDSGSEKKNQSDRGATKVDSSPKH